MTRRSLNALQLLAAVMTFFCMVHAQAAPINMSIVSGTGWRSTDAATGNWTAVGYDDSAWRTAYAPYPNPSTPEDIAGGPTTAELMWDWPGGTPDGGTGPIEAWFRYTFDLPATPSALPLLGQALIIADDQFELFINGTKYDFGDQSTLLADNKRPDGTPRPLLVDFSSLLRNGSNVLAIHAADGLLSEPFPRAYEFVFFDGTIRTVPEPESAALLVLGLIIMSSLSRRLRRSH